MKSPAGLVLERDLRMAGGGEEREMWCPLCTRRGLSTGLGRGEELIGRTRTLGCPRTHVTARSTR